MDFYRRLLFPLLSVIMCTLTSPTASQTDTPFYPPSSGEAFRNIIVGGSHILIGSSTSVHRINPTSLALEDSRQTGSANRMLVTDPGGTFSGHVLACTSLNCTLSPVNNLTDIRWQVPNGGPNGVIRAGTENVLGSFAPGANGTSSLSFGERQSSVSVDPSTIRRGNLVNVNVTGSFFFSRYASQGESRFTPRDFLATFNSQSFIYFIVRIGVIIDGMRVDQLRVVRFCQEDPGSSVVGSDEFVSHFELVAECSGSSSGIPTAAAYIGTNSTFGNDTFLVAFMADGGGAPVQHMCAYDIGTINARMMQKFSDCLNGNGLFGFSRARDSGESACPTGLTPEQIQGANPCSLPGTLLPGQEVENPLVQQTLMEQPLLGGYFTTIVHNTLDNSQFIFAGTTEGRLYQYHVINSTRSVLVRNITLQFSSSTGTNETNITQLRASSDGQHIYVLTPKKLIKHQVDMCEGFTSCETCVRSADPICGWCSLERRCTRQVNCSPVNINQLEWRTSASQCPTITRAEPPVIFFPQLTSGRTITLQTSNIPTGLSYQCVFDFGNLGDRVPESATRSGDQVTCTVPAREKIPDLPAGQDTVDSEVSLRYTNGVDFVTLATPVGFTNCSVHTSCTPCINSPQNCGWCPFSFRCLPHQLAGVSCEGSEETMNNSCPVIRPHRLTSNYLVHTNYSYPRNQLTIEAENLGNFADRFQQGQFWCVICTGSNCLFNLSASLNPDGTLVTCQATEFRYPGVEAIVNATLRVVWSVNDRNIDNPESAGVTLYSCPRMGTNCAQCLSIPSAYNCSHCSTSGGSGSTRCMFEDMCGAMELNSPSEVGQCDAPVIQDFSPKSGPQSGGTEITITGTNLGADRSDILSVRIDGVDCPVTDYQPGISIKCVTDEGESRLVSDFVSIRFGYRSDPTTSLEQFTYEIPSLANPPATPNKGPQSGGTNITIRGEHLGIGSSHNVTVANRECRIHEIRENSIMCETSSSEVVSEGIIITVSVDNWMGDSAGFEYVADPTFESISPSISFASGGTNYTVSGTNLDSVQQPRLLFYTEGMAEQGRRRRQTAGQSSVQSQPCTADAMNPSRMLCPAPAILSTNGSMGETSIGLLMDGVRDLLMLNSTVVVHPDPSFTMFEGVQEFSQNEDIVLTIQGERFVFTGDQISIEITPCRDQGLCVCTVLSVSSSSNSMECEIANPTDLETERALTVTIHLGNQVQPVGMIRINEPLNLLIILILVFAGVIVFSGAIFIVVVAVFCRKTRQKDQKYDQLILELERLESSVARECKLGFAELQTDLDELTGDVAGCHLPYLDIQSYLISSLFPGARDHPVMHVLQVPSQRRVAVERAIRDFGDLIHDKKVLLIFIHTLEEQRGFSIRDKSIVGSLLMVALHNRLGYATEILRTLLGELIRRTVTQSYPKLLLRRTESVAERMLTNWLTFCLHGYIMEHTGQPLYLLYRAVKNQLEKGPIDVITGEARYSLSEQKLIRQKMDVEVIDAHVDLEDGLRVPVKLQDCDTISQAKEKILDAMYKAAPVSQRPSLTSVDLEYLKSPMEHMILRDEDGSMVMEGGWKKINTLRHYWVQNNAVFRLRARKDHAPPGRTFDYPASLIATHFSRQRGLSEAEDGSRVWHLFKQLDVEDPRRSPFMNKKMVTEIYLPRMLSTKSILQKFVDDLFNGLFNTTHPPSSPSTVYSSFFPRSPGVQVPMGYAPGADAVPMAIKYLFDFLDDEAENARITDPDVVHTWKNNALSLRFWVNMIKNPEFVFDINKSHTVDACLSVIAQAFIDGCSSAEMKLTIDSPTSKLLYNKEVQGYKAQVKRYYQEVRQLPRIPEDAMQYYLKQLSGYQGQLMRKTGGFVTESALNELLRYATKYHEPFLSNLRSAGLESKAQLFEGVLRVTLY